MSLVVEDGTGLAEADAYVSLAELKTYWLNRGVDLTDTSEDDQLEAKVREATDYIDTIGRIKGGRATGTQALEFPRTQCLDWSGYEVTGLPARVKKACAELVYKALTTGQTLYADAARGGKVRSESVGPISVTYADDAPTGTVFTQAMNLLAPLMVGPGGSKKAVPVVSSSAVAASSGAPFIGMHDITSVEQTDYPASLG